MRFGFSWAGLVFLVMLFVPNALWTRAKPAGYDGYAKNEPRVLLALERSGEVLVSCLALIFKNHDPRGWEPWLAWLGVALVLMILYEVFWLRYFRSGRTMRDFYGSLLGVPVPGATFPVAAVLMIAVYGGDIFLLAAGVVLGVGHIGIHLRHRAEARGAEA